MSSAVTTISKKGSRSNRSKANRWYRLVAEVVSASRRRACACRMKSRTPGMRRISGMRLRKVSSFETVSVSTSCSSDPNSDTTRSNSLRSGTPLKEGYASAGTGRSCSPKTIRWDWSCIGSESIMTPSISKMIAAKGSGAGSGFIGSLRRIRWLRPPGVGAGRCCVFYLASSRRRVRRPSMIARRSNTTRSPAPERK